jgi:hypothetical protein
MSNFVGACRASVLSAIVLLAIAVESGCSEEANSGNADAGSGGKGTAGQGGNGTGGSAGKGTGGDAAGGKGSGGIGGGTGGGGGTGARSAPLSKPDGGTCKTGYFLYDDHSCPPPGALDAGLSDAQCNQEGDLLCHERCTSDADCRDPSRPYCRILGLFANYDWNCNVGVRICRDRDANDCVRTPLDLL